jgi:phosphate/sulfate permease
MVLSLLLSAIIWNFGTWYFGLPSSSSHALIGRSLALDLRVRFSRTRGLDPVSTGSKRGKLACRS